MNEGKKIELDFVSNLNGHYYNELNTNLKKFILFIFKDFDQTSKLYCKKLCNHQKADICVSNGNKVKYISLKSGSQNSVHVEKIRYNAEESKIMYKKQILKFNNYINDSKVLTKIIERFLLIGTRPSNKYVDFIYYGDINKIRKINDI